MLGQQSQKHAAAGPHNLLTHQQLANPLQHLRLLQVCHRQLLLMDDPCAQPAACWINLLLATPQPLRLSMLVPCAKAAGSTNMLLATLLPSKV